ncbi:MAG: sensor histidine kinase, partial [Planctomycetaceae bacterium]
AGARILEELVENALAFSPEGAEIEIAVSVREGRPEVRVTDHGPGVDPAVAERIFDPLEQAEDLFTRTHQGVGIGLSLARLSARAMDGDVVLERSDDAGSTFLWIVSAPAAPEV